LKVFKKVNKNCIHQQCNHYYKNESSNCESWTNNHSHSRYRHFFSTMFTVSLVWQTQWFIWTKWYICGLKRFERYHMTGSGWIILKN